MGIALLGPLVVNDGAVRLGSRDRTVLTALAMRPGEELSAERLADAVWSDVPPASWQKNLQGCVVRLRKALGAESIVTSPQGYRLIVPADAVDGEVFQRAAQRGGELLALGSYERAAFTLRGALALWRGPPLVDLEDWEPASQYAEQLEELRQETQELWLEAALKAGHHGEVLPEAQAMVRAMPLRERRWQLLALAQYQSGRQGDALRTLHQLRRVLVAELGADPGPELVALEQAILRQEPGLLVEPAQAAPAEGCPYRGLTPYDIADAEGFFGRHKDVAACLERLHVEGVLAVVGPSGSGKSSLVRAGIAAALERDGRSVMAVIPGAHPVDVLSALPDRSRHSILLVDQCEEIFSLCQDAAERRAFLDRVVEHARTEPVVVALRADRMGDVSGHAGFARLVERGLYVLAAMAADDLVAAIEGPARQVGLIVEPGLVDLLVREVEGEPGALPLLSHALRETWLRREGRTLTVSAYQASGGIRGAVAQSAEDVYGQVGEGERRAMRELLLRLVTPGLDGEAVRSRVPRRLVVSDPTQDHLIDLLVATRLVTSDDGVVELAHEALARAWPRLGAWLQDDVDGQRIRHHLTNAADAWNSLDRPDSELYRGVRLARALDWRADKDTALTEVEQQFLEMSSHHAEAEQQSIVERARAQARMIRRLRMVLGGGAVLLVLALVAGALAVVQTDRANENAARAEQAAVSADARRVGARAQLTDDISLSLLLAAAGARLDDSPETRANLLTALAERPTLVRSAPPGGGYLEIFAVSRDGRWVASSDDQNRMHLYDASTNRLLRSYDAGGGSGYIVPAFSPDSRQLAVIMSGSESTEPVRLLDPNTMQPTTTLELPGGKPVWGVDVRFSADGRYLAATVHTDNWPIEWPSDDPGYAVVWDLRSPSTPPIRVPTGTYPQGVALSPDGQILYTDWQMTAYDVATGKQIWRRGDVTSIASLDVNAEGTLLALADTGKKALLVSASTGETVHTLRGHRAFVRDIGFSPDGSLVGSVSHGGELILWDTATGRPLERWDTTDPWGVGFSPDGDLVYGGGSDSMLRTWDLSAEDTYLQQTIQVGDADVFGHADFSPDGQQVAYSWIDDTGQGWVRFVDTVTGEATPPARVPVSGGPMASGTWHPQGRKYIAYTFCIAAAECGAGGPAAVVLDPATGRIVEKRELVDGYVSSIAYVDGNRRLLVGDEEGRTHLLDADSLLPEGDGFEFAARFSTTPIGDGSTAMVHEYFGDGTSGHWRVVDVSTGDVLSEGALDLVANASVASPDGSTVAVAGATGEIVTIDVSTGDEQRRFAGLGAEVLWLDYSEDGELLVSGADDGGVSLWDATTLDLLGTVYPPHRGVAVPAGVQFIGDSHDVAIASYDGRVYRWETDVERAIDFACQMAGRNLTDEEWEEFLPAQPFQSVCPDA